MKATTTKSYIPLVRHNDTEWLKMSEKERSLRLSQIISENFMMTESRVKQRECVRNLPVHLVNAGLISKEEYQQLLNSKAECKRYFNVIVAHSDHKRRHSILREEAWEEYLLEIETLIQSKFYDLWLYYEKIRFDKFHAKLN